VVKRVHRDAQHAFVATVSESIVEVPPLLLIIKLPSRKGTSKEPALVPDKLDFLHLIFLYFFSSFP